MDKSRGRDAPSTGVKKQTRTRTGCLNCRRKKRKCDEGRPVCGTCRRRSEQCEWGLKISFRTEHAQGIDESHPSMKRMARNRPPREFEIVDVTSDVIQDYHHPTSWIESDNEANDRLDYRTYQTENALTMARGYSTRGNKRRRQNPDSFQTPPDLLSPSSQLQTESAVANLIYLSQGGPPQTSPLDPDLQMDMMTDYPFMGQGQDDSHNQETEDHVLIPGSAFSELHSVVRGHLIQEARSTGEGRISTSQFNAEWGEDSLDADKGPRGTTVFSNSLVRSNHSLLPSDNVVCHLWRNWFNEIAPWLDKFDSDQHFRTVIPSIARNHDYLRYSMLALSARQLELKGSTLSTGHSLDLYHEAIHRLLPHLSTRDTAVISTCVILCVMELLNSSSENVRHNLHGCATLIQAMGIDGFVVGVEEAMFWCFARMDICSGLAASASTLIPATNWSSELDMDHTAQLFKGGKGFEQWPNYALYLLSNVLGLLASSRTDTFQAHQNNPSFRDDWLKLWKYVYDWYQKRPAQFMPIMTMPSSEKFPFPTILHSNPAAISGIQLHHAASILMLQNQPSAVRLNPRPRSILWHARQICGISISNEDHAAWMDGVQPLLIAGKCMSHSSEHKAILELLEKMQKVSGWRTGPTAESLKDFWGDLGD